jgi:hypothetical protein
VLQDPEIKTYVLQKVKKCLHLLETKQGHKISEIEIKLLKEVMHKDFFLAGREITERLRLA